MRIDKYLKVSRIIKRRTLAQEACNAGFILLNGKEAKSSAKVKEGDVLEVNTHGRSRRFEIVAVADTVAKQDAASLYKEL